MVSKKGAVELSIGTIVIIVLAMSMLILGIVLIKNIFTSGIDIVDMTDDQLKKQVSQLFGDDRRLVMYPDSEEIVIKIGERSGFRFAIKNRLPKSDAKFSYEVIIDDEDIRRKCEVSESEVEKWITIGRTGSSIDIPPGELGYGKVVLVIPEGQIPCQFRLRTNVKESNTNYATGIMDIIIKP